MLGPQLLQPLLTPHDHYCQPISLIYVVCTQLFGLVAKSATPPYLRNSYHRGRDSKYNQINIWAINQGRLVAHGLEVKQREKCKGRVRSGDSSDIPRYTSSISAIFGPRCLSLIWITPLCQKGLVNAKSWPGFVRTSRRFVLE